MNELEMIKAFAKLEGFNCVEINGVILVARGFACDRPFNPLLPNALNCAARDKYGVTIEYMQDEDCITLDFISIFITDRNKLCKTVIECILKSKGLWK